MTRPVVLAIALLAVMMTLNSCGGKTKYIRRNLESNALEGIPSGADSLIYIDVERLRANPLASGLVAQMGAFEESDPFKLIRFQSDNGIDLYNEVNRAVIAYYDTDNPEEMSWLVLLIGDFKKFDALDTMKISSIEFEDRLYGDMSMYNINRGTYTFALTFFSPREMALASKDTMIHRMIELYKGAPNHIQNDALYKDLEALIPPQAILWALDSLSATEMQQAKEMIRGLGDDPESYGIDSVKYMMATIDMNQDAVIQLTMQTDPATTADNLYAGIEGRLTSFRRAIQMLQAQSGGGGNEIQQFFDYLKLSHEGNKIQASLTIPGTQVMQWITTAQMMAGPAIGGVPGGSMPPPASPPPVTTP